MLDPFIIAEILRREREKRERANQQQPTTSDDDREEAPESHDHGQPKPAYDMPSQGDRDKPDTGERGVTDIPLGEVDIPENAGEKTDVGKDSRLP